MAEVRALQDVGQFTASIDELREILAVAPDLPEANYRLGVALAQTGNPSRAVWALQKASESSDYEIVATLLLASVQFGLNNYEEGIRAANRVLEIDPSRAVALQIRAKSNLGINQLDLALEDTERLLEMNPDDYQTRVVHATVLSEMGRLEEAEAANELVKEMAEASGDPQTAGRGCLSTALFAKDDLKDMERAEALYNECAEKYPTDTFITSHIMAFFDQIGKPERATEIIRRAVEEKPENLSLRGALAARLRGLGDSEAAEKVLRDAVESFGSAAAWNQLVGFYRNEDDSAQALEAIEKVIELSGGGGDQVRFTHADLLVDVGDLDRAEEVAKALDEPTYAKMIRGRILLVRGDPAGALAAFDEGIRNWPNNAGARYLAGVAAMHLGDYDRAAIELREAMRVEDAQTDAPSVLARLHLDRAEYAQAVNFANAAIQRRGGKPKPDDYRIVIRALAGMGEFDRARNSVGEFKKLPGQEAAAAVELATVERVASGPEAAIKVLESSELDLNDPANEEPLRAMIENLTAAGQAARAMEIVDAAIQKSPDHAKLHALRGVALARDGRSEVARAAFARALELDSELAEAVGGQATLEGRDHNWSEAIALFDRAAKLDPSDDTYPYSAAQLAIASEDHAGAETRLREVVKGFPGHAESRNDLAWLLAERGAELDYALELAEDATRMSPSPDLFDTLGFVHLKRGESSAAVAALEKALEGRKDSPSIRYRLGTALSQAGEEERAREMLTRALESGSFPEADDARRVLAQLDES